MAMPRNLILIRHGESEGNVANTRSRQGDNSAFTDEFYNRHSSLWRLSDKGIEQAKKTGEWLKKEREGKEPLFRCYTSEYVRAMETAAHLDIPDAKWFSEFYLRERNWGDMDRMTEEDRNRLYENSVKEKKIEQLYWTPPNGESLADVGLRVDRIFQTLHRECDGKDVVIVCHGEIMMMIRARLERLTQEKFGEILNSKDEKDKVHNCQVIQYTRENPEDSSDLRPYVGWMKSTWPWDEDLSKNTWEEIPRTKFSNDELLERVNKIKRLVD